jgi:hypothetical protein
MLGDAPNLPRPQWVTITDDGQADAFPSLVSIRMLQLQDKDLQGGSAGALSQWTISLLDVASSSSRVCSVFGTADLADLAGKLCRATISATLQKLSTLSC